MEKTCLREYSEKCHKHRNFDISFMGNLGNPNSRLLKQITFLFFYYFDLCS